MAEQLAKAEDGTLKPVSEFTPAEKWWCFGEGCDDYDAELGPHVHPYSGPALAVDLLTGWAVTR